MAKKVRVETSFVDALEKSHRYAVLTKAGRVQILIKPSAKQLRKRGKRGWQLHGVVDEEAESERTLLEMVRGAIRDKLRETGEESTDGRG